MIQWKSPIWRGSTAMKNWKGSQCLAIRPPTQKPSTFCSSLTDRRTFHLWLYCAVFLFRLRCALDQKHVLITTDSLIRAVVLDCIIDILFERGNARVVKFGKATGIGAAVAA